jgi:type I restriction enzyme S subunit
MGFCFCINETESRKNDFPHGKGVIAMARVKLNEIAVDVRETYKGSQKDIPIVGLEHITPEDINLALWDTNVENTFTKHFCKGDVLFGRRRAYLKKAALAPFDGICSGDITVIRAKDGVLDPSLLPFIVQNDQLFDFAVSQSAGSLSPRVKWEHLGQYELNLPPLDEQKKLAEVLWSIDDTLQSYKKLLVETDNMMKSRFIEMFGIPFTDARKPNRRFEDFVLEMIKGPFGSDMKKTLLVEKGDDTYKVYLQVNAIQQNEHLGESYISKEYYNNKMSRFAVHPGDYLITCDGTLGKYVRLDEDMEPGVISPSLLRLKLNEENVLPRFFEAYWDYFIVDYLVARARNTALVHLPSAKVIGEVELFLPELCEQQQYSDFARQSDKSKVALQESIDALMATKKSIMRDAFCC